MVRFCKHPVGCKHSTGFFVEKKIDWRHLVKMLSLEPVDHACRNKNLHSVINRINQSTQSVSLDVQIQFRDSELNSDSPNIDEMPF